MKWKYVGKNDHYIQNLMSEIVFRMVDQEKMFNELADRFIRIRWNIPYKNLWTNQEQSYISGQFLMVSELDKPVEKVQKQEEKKNHFSTDIL